MEGSRSKAKVVVVGDRGVGKRSLVRRSSFDPFEDRWVDVLGATLSKKEILLPLRLRDGTYIDLILWTVSSVASRGRARTFASHAAGILAVCDATRAETLAHLGDQIETVRKITGPIPTVIVANKWDLETERQIAASDVESLAGKYQSDFFLASEATGANVEDAFQSLGERIVICRREKGPANPAQGPP